MLEFWKPIAGYETRYQISNQGQVKSLLSGKLLVATLSGKPKTRRAVWLAFNGSKNIKLVAHLVADAFLGPKPVGLHVLHRNDVPTDDRAINLYYGTHAQNMVDRNTNGHTQRGSKHYRARFTEDQVRSIRELLATETQRDIAQKFGVSRGAVRNIKSGKTWGWLS